MVIAIITFALLQSSCENWFVKYQIILFSTKMPSLTRKEKVAGVHCGTQVTRINLSRHKKRCSVGKLYCAQWPNFSSRTQNDLNYHITKKHSTPKPDVTFKCKLCYPEFPGFYALRQRRNTQHGMQIISRTIDVDVEHIVGDVEDHSLRE